MNLSGVLLDQGSLDAGDINLNTIVSQFSQWNAYSNSNPTETLQRLENAEIVISNKVLLDASIINNNPQLKLICIAATGVNNVDLVAAKKMGIAVCNVAGYATPSVVQHVFSLILALQTNLCDYSSKVFSGEWAKAEHFCLLDSPITELQGKTLGIIGYGELGQAVEKVAIAFGLNILIAESFSGRTSENRTPLDDVLKQSDIVTLHCPLSEQTNNLIDTAALSKMKSSAFLINTARGGIVNEADLAVALDNNIIAGAALDVLSQEPPVKNILLENHRKNLIITPHIAWASQQSRQRLIDEIGKNISAFRKGKSRNLIV